MKSSVAKGDFELLILHLPSAGIAGVLHCAPAQTHFPWCSPVLGDFFLEQWQARKRQQGRGQTDTGMPFIDSSASFQAM